jgi:hypothetical protein
MKLLVVSDTHRKLDNLIEIIEQEKPFDLLIHLGDTEGDEDTIEQLVDCPSEIVAGNNDFFSELPREKEIELMGHRLLLTHGHYYYVGMGLDEIKRQASGRNCDIVMFGHTHRPLVDYGNPVIAMNPGSASYPRQEGKRPSYIVVELAEDGSVSAQIKYLE